MKYLFIFEDMDMRVCESFTDDDADAVDAGCLDVIQLGDMPKQYYEGDWHDIPKADLPHTEAAGE